MPALERMQQTLETTINLKKQSSERACFVRSHFSQLVAVAVAVCCEEERDRE